MKNGSRIIVLALFVLGLASFAAAQQSATVYIPRESQRASVMQTVGDTNITIVYHRPSVKGREVWGKLVPYGEVWRTGANDNTTFEVSENVKINGQDLPAGKYSLHTIPNRDEWTIIFNKVSNAWGSYTYKPDQDALRVKAKPQAAGMSREVMAIEFDNIAPTTTDVVIEWEKLRVPFTVDVGDAQGRTLAKLRQSVTNAPDDQAKVTTRLQAVSYVLGSKIKSSYAEAGIWVDEAVKMRENFTTLRAKARFSAETGNYKDAVAYGEKAIAAGKAAERPDTAAIAAIEKDVATWKTKK